MFWAKIYFVRPMTKYFHSVVLSLLWVERFTWICRRMAMNRNLCHKIWIFGSQMSAPQDTIITVFRASLEAHISVHDQSSTNSSRAYYSQNCRVKIFCHGPDRRYLSSKYWNMNINISWFRYPAASKVDSRCSLITGLCDGEILSTFWLLGCRKIIFCQSGLTAG